MATRSTRARLTSRRGGAEPSGPLLTWTVFRTFLGVGALAGGCLAALALVFPDGRLTEPLHVWLYLGLGWTAPLAPLWLLVLAVPLLSGWPTAATGGHWRRLAGLVLVTAAAPPAVHMLLAGQLSSLELAQGGLGGGWAGHLLVQALAYALGTAGSVALLALALIAGFLLLAGISGGQAASGVITGLRGGWRFLCWTVRQVVRRDAPVPDPRVAPLDPGWWERFTGLFVRRMRALPEVGGGGPALPVKAASGRGWELPPLSLFRPGGGGEVSQADLRLRARLIEETLASFNVEARVIEVNPGPTVTQFGLEPSPGVAVNRVLARSNDLALRLGASPIRMEAPVPGKRVIGLEIPNAAVSTVTIRDLVQSSEFERVNSRLRLALGRDVSGRPVIGDLAKMPHLLIAGATGSGKSVCINSIVASLLVQSTPDDLQFLMIDPKMVELTGFAGIPHLRMPVVTDMERVVGALKWAVHEMERRYGLLSRRGARNMDAYNRLVAEQPGEQPLSYLVIVVDELADMMMTAADEVERTLCRLAQLGRAAGLHLVVATQRPSVDVLTGLIKANFVTRIAFAVSSQVDSRVILDSAGADKLLGRGDMLYQPADVSKPIRLQGAFVSDQEISDLVSFWQHLGEPQYSDDEVRELAVLGRLDEVEDDELYARAEGIARQYSRISVSLLQRRLGIGYPRAARLVDLMEERGLVGPSVDGRSRDVVVRAPAALEVEVEGR